MLLSVQIALVLAHSDAQFLLAVVLLRLKEVVEVRLSFLFLRPSSLHVFISFSANGRLLFSA